MGIRRMAISAAAAVLALSAAGLFVSAVEHRDDFDSPRSSERWGAVRSDRGKWELDLERQVYKHVREPDDGSQSSSISSYRMGDGSIEVRAAATRHNEVNRGGCFGIVAKYIDADNWYAVRFGGYGTVNIRGFIDGERFLKYTGYQWSPEIDRVYTARVKLKGSRMLVYIDGDVVTAIGGLPFPGEEGYTGVFALSSAYFEYFKLGGL